MDLEIKTFTGLEIKEHITGLAHLRIEVFKDYPYLYDGDLEYEEKYLARYFESPNFLMVMVFDDQRVVGASTALPLIHETPEIQQSFETAEFTKEDILYLGESVLLSNYRGKGIGHQFFDYREAHARRLGLNITTFCAVQRPDGHSMKPANYRSNDKFWAGRGYTERPDLQTELLWTDVGDQEETSKIMRFWVRNLDD